MLFDQYSRYRALALACKAVDNTIYSPYIDGEDTAKGSTRHAKTIYDIGSGPYKLLSDFLPNNHISFVDPLLNSNDSTNPLESIFAIDLFKDFEQIKNKKEDIVVSIDTYEHIPANLRKDFLTKVISLAKESVILAFPYKDAAHSTNVDDYVNNFFKKHFSEDYLWLKEHYEYGLPYASDAISFFKDNGFHANCFYQGNCEWLKKLLPTIIALNEFNFLSPLTEKFSEFFNTELARYDICDNGYRIFVIATKKEISLDILNPAPAEVVKNLSSRIDEINTELTHEALFPTLGILREAKKEMIQIEKRSVEMGEWGQSLYATLTELQKDNEELRAQSNEVGKWGQSLQEKIIALEKDYLELQKRSNEVGVWAQSLHKRVHELENQIATQKK